MKLEGLKLFIGTVTTRGLHRKAAETVVRLVQHLGRLGVDVVFETDGSAPMTRARAELGELYLESRREWALWLDDDHSFTPDVVERMFAAEQPFVCCAYPGRKPADHASATQVMLCSLALHESFFSSEAPVIRRGAVRVHGCGMGVVLTHRSVLERIEAALGDELPRFQSEPRAPAMLRGFWTEILQNGHHYHHDDAAFCRRARAAGVELWALYDAEISHHHAGFTFTGNFRHAVDDCILRHVDELAKERAAKQMPRVRMNLGACEAPAATGQGAQR